MSKSIYLQVGSRVREIREQMGITQEKLAFKAEIHPSFLSHIERGTKKASLETMEKLAEALGVPTQNLFAPQEEPITYLKSEEELFIRKISNLLKDKDAKFKQVVWRVVKYLDEDKK